MSETFSELVLIIDEQGSDGIRLDANGPRITIGGDPADRPGGVLELRDTLGHSAIELDANTPAIRIGRVGGGPGGALHIVNRDSRVSFQIDGDTGRLILGAEENCAGFLAVRDTAGREVCNVDAGVASLTIGTYGHAGTLRVVHDEHDAVFSFAASDATLHLGAEHRPGELKVHDAANRSAFQVIGWNAHLALGRTDNPGIVTVQDGANRTMFRLLAADASLDLGGTGKAGYFAVRDAAGQPALRLDASTAHLLVGVPRNAGRLTIRDADDRSAFLFTAASARLSVGTTGNGGDLTIQDAANRPALQFSGDGALLILGATGNAGDMLLRDNTNTESIRLDGQTGRITTRGGDLAEQFDLAEAAEAAPGMVMALAGDGRLVPAAAAYDPRVVGVVAGAGRHGPGIVMDHDGAAAGRRVPIAMAGKAACRVDAGHGPVRVGDLLTSSPTPGCAMRAADPARAFGAVVGKALTPLDEGTGLVEMIISLQ